MPRDISGNYTLPVGNPVVSGTIIDVAWANPTMSDIATQLNGVMTRDGVLPATGPIRFTDGSASAPAIAFTGATATGFYRSGTTLGMSIAGTAAFEIASAAATLSRPLLIPNTAHNLFIGSALSTYANLYGGVFELYGGSPYINLKSSVSGGVNHYLAPGSLDSSGFSHLVHSGVTQRNLLQTDIMKTTGMTVAQLPSAVTAGEGARAFVTDSTVTAFGNTVSGGGSNKVPVCSNGSTWFVA